MFQVPSEIDWTRRGATSVAVCIFASSPTAKHAVGSGNLQYSNSSFDSLVLKMFQSFIKSISGSFSDVAKWELTADRSEVALRNGLEKSVLFVLCSSAITGISALTLVSASLLSDAHTYVNPFSQGISQRPVYCDRGLAFWNGFLGGMVRIYGGTACIRVLSTT